MTYEEKLKDPRWQRKRLEVFERDNWTCRACGETTKTLSVHHPYYENNEDGTPKDPWDYPTVSLVTMCVDCHEMEDRSRFAKGGEDAIIETLRRNGFVLHEIWELCRGINIVGQMCAIPGVTIPAALETLYNILKSEKEVRH